MSSTDIISKGCFKSSFSYKGLRINQNKILIESSFVNISKLRYSRLYKVYYENSTN